MKKYTFVVFVSIIFLCNFATGWGYTIGIGNTKYNISSIKLNDIDYVNSAQLISIFHCSNTTVSIKPYNFFVRILSDTNPYIIQLNALPITQNGILYVPIKSFIRSVCEVAKLKYDIIYNASFIEKDEKFIAFFSPIKSIIEPINNKIAIKNIDNFKPQAMLHKSDNTTELKFNTEAPQIDTIMSIPTKQTTNIFIKPQMSKLSKGNDDYMKAIKNEVINEPNTIMSSNNLIAPLINPALPPFGKKYSIPDAIKKTQLNELR